MIKIYVMESCPDCTEVKALYSDNPEYELIDIGRQARSLKEFLALRDHHPAFTKVRERGNIGIPCFVREAKSIINAPPAISARAKSVDKRRTTLRFVELCLGLGLC